MRKKLLLLMFLGMTVMSGRAQRTTDVIDRGLVAVKTGSGIFCSWRVTAEESMLLKLLCAARHRSRAVL